MLWHTLTVKSPPTALALPVWIPATPEPSADRRPPASVVPLGAVGPLGSVAVAVLWPVCAGDPDRSEGALPPPPPPRQAVPARRSVGPGNREELHGARDVATNLEQ